MARLRLLLAVAVTVGATASSCSSSDSSNGSSTGGDSGTALGLRLIHGGLGLERQLRSQCQLQFRQQRGNEGRLYIEWQLWLRQRLGGQLGLERKLGQFGVERSG